MDTSQKPKAALIVLGCEGTLGNAIISQRVTDTHLIGIDRYSQSQTVETSQYFSCDFKDRPEVGKTLAALPIETFDQLTIVSCVGKFGDETFLSDKIFNPDFLYDSIQVNLTAVAHFAVDILSRSHHMSKRRVVIVGSAAASVGSRDIGYGIAKAGLNGLVVSLSKTLANNSACIIGVNPGVFESPMSASVAAGRKAKAIQSTHIQRAGTIAEIANVVRYAAFDAPDYLTGSILNVNGGQYT